MKYSAVLFLSILTIFMYAGPVYAGSCNDLTVNITASNWTIFSSNMGTINSNNSSVSMYSNSTYEVTVQFSYYSGSGADVHAATSTYKVKQNWCVLMGGDLTVTHVSGSELHFSKSGASYSGGYGGTVTFTSVKTW